MAVIQGADMNRATDQARTRKPEVRLHDHVSVSVYRPSSESTDTHARHRHSLDRTDYMYIHGGDMPSRPRRSGLAVHGRFGAMANGSYWDPDESRELAASPSVSPTANVEVLVQRDEMPLPLEVVIACTVCAIAVLLFHRYRQSKTGKQARTLNWRWETLQKVTPSAHAHAIWSTSLSQHTTGRHAQEYEQRKKDEEYSPFHSVGIDGASAGDGCDGAEGPEEEFKSGEVELVPPR